MKLSYVRCLVLSLMASCLVGITPAIAQSQEEKPVTNEQTPEAEETQAEEDEEEKAAPEIPKFTDEMVVTATRVETELMKTSVAVSA